MCDQCAICLENFEDTPSTTGHDRYALPCNHSFHVDCIMQTFRRGDSKCPLCRNIPEYCRSEDEIMEQMESIARLEWKKHNELRNRWARKDEEVKLVRKKFWDARDKVRTMGNTYNRDFQKALRASIRDVNREYKDKRKKLQKAIQHMYTEDIAFDKIIHHKRNPPPQE